MGQLPRLPTPSITLMSRNYSLCTRIINIFRARHYGSSLRWRFNGPHPGSLGAVVYRFHHVVRRAVPIPLSPRVHSIRLPLFETYRLIPEGAVDPKYIEESMDTPDTGSFMHLHLGVDGKGLDDLDIHYSVSREEGHVGGNFPWSC